VGVAAIGMFPSSSPLGRCCVVAGSSCGFPCVRGWRQSSEDSGGGNAASAVLCLLWLGFFRGGAGSKGSGGHFAALHFASRSQWGWW